MEKLAQNNCKTFTCWITGGGHNNLESDFGHFLRFSIASFFSFLEGQCILSSSSSSSIGASEFSRLTNPQTEELLSLHRKEAAAAAGGGGLRGNRRSCTYSNCQSQYVYLPSLNNNNNNNSSSSRPFGRSDTYHYHHHHPEEGGVMSMKKMWSDDYTYFTRADSAPSRPGVIVASAWRDAAYLKQKQRSMGGGNLPNSVDECFPNSQALMYPHHHPLKSDLLMKNEEENILTPAISHSDIICASSNTPRIFSECVSTFHSPPSSLCISNVASLHSSISNNSSSCISSDKSDKAVVSNCSSTPSSTSSTLSVLENIDSKRSPWRRQSSVVKEILRSSTDYLPRSSSFEEKQKKKKKNNDIFSFSSPSSPDVIIANEKKQKKEQEGNIKSLSDFDFSTQLRRRSFPSTSRNEIPILSNGVSCYLDVQSHTAISPSVTTAATTPRFLPRQQHLSQSRSSSLELITSDETNSIPSSSSSSSSFSSTSIPYVSSSSSSSSSNYTDKPGATTTKMPSRRLPHSSIFPKSLTPKSSSSSSTFTHEKKLKHRANINTTSHRHSRQEWYRTLPSSSLLVESKGIHGSAPSSLYSHYTSPLQVLHVQYHRLR